MVELAYTLAPLLVANTSSRPTRVEFTEKVVPRSERLWPAV